jgi:hypothetical protein
MESLIPPADRTAPLPSCLRFSRSPTTLNDTYRQ